MPLPNSQKYRPAEVEKDKPWDDPLVVKANEEVPIVTLLTQYWKLDIPDGAEGWKVRCPFAYEHRDGGLDRQFRVYSSTNSSWCFAIHGYLTPVRLWRLRTGSPTLKDAAKELLRIFGIQLRQPTWQERFAEIRAEVTRREEITADSMIEAFQIYLATRPEYSVRQFDGDVLTSVNSMLEEVQEFCTRRPTLEEARQWLVVAQARVSALLTCP